MKSQTSSTQSLQKVKVNASDGNDQHEKEDSRQKCEPGKEVSTAKANFLPFDQRAMFESSSSISPHLKDLRNALLALAEFSILLPLADATTKSGSASVRARNQNHDGESVEYLSKNFDQTIGGGDLSPSSVLRLGALMPGAPISDCQFFQLDGPMGRFTICAEQALVETVMEHTLPGWRGERHTVLGDIELVAPFLWHRLSAGAELEALEQSQILVCKSPLLTAQKASALRLQSLVGRAIIGNEQFEWGILLDDIMPDRKVLSKLRSRKAALWLDMPINAPVKATITLQAEQLTQLEKGVVLVLQSATEDGIAVNVIVPAFGILTGTFTPPEGARNIDYIVVGSWRSSETPAHKRNRMVHNLACRNTGMITGGLGPTVTMQQTDTKKRSTSAGDLLENELHKAVETGQSAKLDLDASECPPIETQHLASDDVETAFSAPNQGVDDANAIDDGSPLFTFDLNTVSVPLSIVLGETSITFGDLSNLRRGSLLEVDLDLNGPLPIQLEGHELGRGELVMIGDALGIHITRWTRPATQTA